MAAAGTPKDDTGLERKMESRHLTMISLGGVIGTGLFVSSGYTIHQAGPLGAILAYAVGSLLVYCVMVSLGELSVAMPYAGSFHMYAKRFIGPGTAFTIAVLYWLNWAVALASEFTAAGLLMQRWFPIRRPGCGRPCSLWWCSRMVWSLAKERLIPARFAKTNFRGVPVWAVLFSMAGSLLALLSSVLAASTV